MKGIFWIVTYAKSGSNWFRIFIDNLIEDGENPVDIFHSPHILDYKSRRFFDLHTGIDSKNLTNEEVDEIRPKLYEYFSQKNEDPLFVKLHSAYTTTPTGQKIIPEATTKGAFYLIRNPLDIVASFASHFGITIDETIDFMEDEDAAFDGNHSCLQPHLRQNLLSWSNHVKSWTVQKGFPVQVLRYEDLLRDPITSFTKVTRFAGLNSEKKRIIKAVHYSSFDEVKKQEKEMKRKYMKVQSNSFFRSGIKGGWRNELTKKQVERIVNRHGSVMKSFGYLNKENKPVY